MSILARNGINGPKPNLILGNLLDFRREENVIVLDNWLKKYGSLFGFYLGGKPVVCVADEDLLISIQVKDFSLFDRRDFGIR